MVTINKIQNLMAQANKLFSIITQRLLPSIATIYRFDVSTMSRDSRRSTVIGLCMDFEDAIKSAIVLWKGSIAQDLAEAKSAMDTHGKEYLVTVDAALHSVEAYLACKPSFPGLDTSAEEAEFTALKKRRDECEQQDKRATEQKEADRARAFRETHSQPLLPASLAASANGAAPGA